LQIEYKTSTMYLKDMPLDIGYASEKVTLKDIDENIIEIGGHNGKTQLIISASYIDDNLKDELKKIDADLPKGGEYEVTAYLVVANNKHNDPKLENIKFLVDSEDEFSDYYGTKLSGTPYEDELTKAIILISKDGAIFYDEFKNNLEDKFNTDTLARKILAAQTCYTGKGCH